MKSKWFRYGFLVFFFAMFFVMLWNTYLVFAEAQDLKQVVTLLWTFKLPWQWAYHPACQRAALCRSSGYSSLLSLSRRR